MSAIISGKTLEVIREILEDRKQFILDQIHAIDSITSDDYTIQTCKDYREELIQIEYTLNENLINDVTESILIDYGTRDGWEESRRHINRALAFSGRLDKVEGSVTVWRESERLFKKCRVQGVEYYAAV